MQETFDLFLGLNDFNWRGSAYQWFFYAGILLTLVFEKRRMLRNVFGWLPLLYLVFMFNPLCMKLLNLAGLHNQAYFTRLFSFMPLMYVIARGFTMLLRIDNGWLKLAAVGLVCAVICVAGKNIYLEDWLVKAENSDKVPRETLKILDAIGTGDDQDVSIAPIDASTVYIRQVGNVITPYGRDINELGNLLSLDPPDVQRIMELAGQQDVDYVVAHNTDATLSAFLDRGYDPFARTTNYDIYRVENVPRLRRVLNEKRQVISATYYNASGEPDPAQRGFASVCYSYDTNGNRVMESYFDIDNNPVIIPDGYFKSIATCSANGNKRTLKYLDQYGNLILKDGRFETRYNYNAFNQLIREAYFDEYGMPMKRTDTLYAVCEMEYKSNQITMERYLDEMDMPTLSSWGYAQKRREYDDLMQLTSETYYDTQGNKIGGVGANEPINTELMAYPQFSNGTQIDKKRWISFETTVNNNSFNAVRFQLYDAVTKAHILNFGDTYSTGLTTGEYCHQLPSGIYTLVFKGNTNMMDEYLKSTEYLREGEVLNYRFSVDELQEKHISISNFSIARK